ncbi:MAG: hypothetical protein JSU85_11430, partial [Candidatus Zixiibacteriota bacterium]
EKDAKRKRNLRFQCKFRGNELFVSPNRKGFAERKKGFAERKKDGSAGDHLTWKEYLEHLESKSKEENLFNLEYNLFP